MKHVRYVVLGALILLVFASCMTPPAQNEEAVLNVLIMLENGEGAKLIEHTHTPFLLDAEIIESDVDMQSFWTLLADRGFAFPAPQIISLTEVTAESAALFGDTMEVQAFFTRYVPEDAAIAEVETNGTRYRFIFAGKLNGLPRLYGWKGPL